MNFLDTELKIVSNTLVFDVFYKPTNYFNCLTFSSCYPSHAKNNIGLSLAKRIIYIVTNNGENSFSELKRHLFERNQPPEIIDYTFTKCFRLKLDKNKDLWKIIFTRSFNSVHVKQL